jgi:uncharacterized protein YbaR (Trm112 family)
MLDSVLPLLRCPVSKLPLTRRDATLLNAAVARGGVCNVAGKPVTEPSDEILLAVGGEFAYLVRDGIPILLPEEAVSAAIV